MNRVFVKDLRKRDVIKGVSCPIQVIGIKDGTYLLKNLNTGDIFDADWNEFIKRQASVEIY